MTRVLVVEDDAPIRRGLVDALQISGYDTIEAKDGPEGMDRAVNGGCDLLLLDLVLPGGDGFSILEEVRSTRPTLPVIILTARGAEDDRVRGLKLGADDYVVKPFSIKELLARVEAVLRRSAERPLDVDCLSLTGGHVDFKRREVSFENGEREELSDREIELLRYLVANRGRVISRDEILARVWRLNPEGLATRAIDMHVVRLRRKLRDDSGEPRVLLAVRGKGYMLGNS
ncbi:MAG: response regulator transcription factor [bacterium]|nr:response regulator transcription factor [bacterium]